MKNYEERYVALQISPCEHGWLAVYLEYCLPVVMWGLYKRQAWWYPQIEGPNGPSDGRPEHQKDQDEHIVEGVVPYDKTFKAAPECGTFCGYVGPREQAGVISDLRKEYKKFHEK